MKNTLTDLNNYLFEQLERLNDNELEGEDLERELHRAQGIGSIAAAITRNGELALKTMKYAQEYGLKKDELPVMLEVKDGQG